MDPLHIQILSAQRFLKYMNRCMYNLIKVQIKSDFRVHKYKTCICQVHYLPDIIKESDISC